MLHELNLGQSYDTALTAKDRNALIRYCISIGTRARCSTRGILRPFKQKYLTSAIHENKSSVLERIAKYKEQINLYNKGELQLNDGLTEYFGGKPSKSQFEKYMRELIKQERDIVNIISKSYIINVDFSHLSKELLEFHNSLNPRITFGYSNSLHEECNFELNDEIKRAFLNSSLKELPTWEQDWTHDWGYVFFDSIIGLLYEDLIVLCGDRCILDTISHEQSMTVYLTDGEIENFISFEGKNNNNSETVNKIKTIINRDN